MRGVLVSGGSRGIGRAVAHRFAEAGDRVAVQYATRRDGAERTLAGLPGHGHALVRGDLAEPGTARRILDDAVAALGAVDVLVNNAAVAPTGDNRHPVTEGSWADWRDRWQRMLAVNLLGAVDLTRAVAEHLIGRGEPGAIVNVGSRAAFFLASPGAVWASGAVLDLNGASYLRT